GLRRGQAATGGPANWAKGMTRGMRPGGTSWWQYQSRPFAFRSQRRGTSTSRMTSAWTSPFPPPRAAGATPAPGATPPWPATIPRKSDSRLTCFAPPRRIGDGVRLRQPRWPGARPRRYGQTHAPFRAEAPSRPRQVHGKGGGRRPRPPPKCGGCEQARSQGRPTMFEHLMPQIRVPQHIRFVDPRGAYFGSSRYRPSEGWLDVVAVN